MKKIINMNRKARYGVSTIIAAEKDNRHTVGNCERIITMVGALGMLGSIDIVEKVEFDMNTAGTITIRKNGETFKARLAKRSARFAIDFVHDLCRSSDEVWNRYKVEV